MIGVGLWVARPNISLTASLLSATESVQMRCLAAVQNRLQQAAWPAVKSVTGGADIQLPVESILVKKIPLERVYSNTKPYSLPCILITPPRPMASATEGVNSADDYGKHVLVTMVMSDNSEPTLYVNLDVISKWQEIVMRAFQNQRLAGVSEVLICHVEPAEAIIPIAWGRNVLASAVLLKFTTREPRGLNA